MNSPALSAELVAQFLQDQPDFFMSHADVFAGLRVPHPHETRAISLGERQIMTLRAKTKDLEWKLAGLIHNATGNEKISGSLIEWCRLMLAQDDASHLPRHIVESLGDLFQLSDIALRVWNLPRLNDDTHALQEVDDATRTYARELEQPYCGPYKNQPGGAWLAYPPASLAIIALREHDNSEPFGLLLLGSDSAERFTPDMGTAFLQTIGELASAALTRLQDPQIAASA
jgi:uncharacterized protein YigA (DUF484 family)